MAFDDRVIPATWKLTNEANSEIGSRLGLELGMLSTPSADSRYGAPNSNHNQVRSGWHLSITDPKESMTPEAWTMTCPAGRCAIIPYLTHRGRVVVEYPDV
jgi:hypothetical protein